MRYLSGETILEPTVRLSHPITGRIPEAKDKPARELLEHEKTLFYERMAFLIEKYLQSQRKYPETACN